LTILVELDHENSALIHRDKLRDLRDKAAKADELEDEVSSLVRQKRAQDARLSELEALHEKNAGNNRLVEDNARLAEELGEHKSASLWVDGLGKENKRLAAELKQTLDRALDIETPARLMGSDGPVSTEPPSSVLRPQVDQSGTVAKRAYESLVRKYNKLYENHADITSAREQLQKALNAKKEEMRKYQEYYDHLERKVKKKDARIGEQDEELRRLRAQIQCLNGEPRMSQGLELTPKIGSRQEREAQNLEEVAMALNSALPGPIHRGGRVTTFNDIIKALNSPTLNDIAATDRRIRAPISSCIQLGSLNGDYSFWLSSTPLGSGPASEPLKVSKASGKSQNERNTVDQLPLLLPGGDNGNDEGVVDTVFEVLEPHHTSSTDRAAQNGSAGNPEAPKIKEEPSTYVQSSPDTPVVISSRSVRKRKGRNDANKPNDNPKVKIETISSSPIGLATIYDLDESIDLDDIGEKQATPRKGRPFLQQALRTSSFLVAARNESQSPDHSHSNRPSDWGQLSQASPTGVSRAGSALQPRSPNTQILPRTSTESAPKRRRIASDKAVGDLIEDGQTIQSVEKSPRRRNTTTEHARLLEDLLAKASPPKQVLRGPDIQSKPRHSGGRASAGSNLAFEFPQDDAPPRPRLIDTFRDSAYFSRPTSRDSPMGHLGHLKPSKASLRTPAEHPRLPSSHSFKDSEESERPTSKSTDLQFKNPASVPKAAQSRIREQTVNPARTWKQPLRTRPLTELTLQDFKVNPKYNQGYNYAFNDVVRNQAERRCLQGCTKPECCGGKFRALAEATRNPNQPLTLSQEEADDKTLKEFLGDSRYKLRNMTKNEREEALIQARAREMSNKYGKHRHAYERRTSPPGYWRSDFPNTQEEVQDRAKAQQLERDQIAQRYKAAMRPGGAYIFRDE
jgi:hypothetical protein